MRHPIMRQTPSRAFSITDFSGGINTKESLDMINDNQIVDGLNVWWKNSGVTTRPGTKTIATFSRKSFNEKLFPKKTDINFGRYYLFYVIVNGYELTNESTTEGTKEKTKEITKTYFWFQSKNKSVEIPFLAADVSFLCQKNNVIYAYCKDRTIHQIKITLKQGELYPEKWKEVDKKDYIVPLIVQNCKSNGHIFMSSDLVLQSGVAVDGYNLLGDYYKLSYNAYNPEVDSGNGHPMLYGLLENTFQSKYNGYEVKVEYTTERGKTYTHSVRLNGESLAAENDVLEDGLKLRVYGSMIDFINSAGSFASITKDNTLENNLIITAPYIPDNREELLDKVFSMTQSTWFGGEALGLSGGTRLFLGGNTKESEKSLVLWSGLNEPLYFSENSYVYVGNRMQAVTGFGKQSDILVIFKENGAGTYYTRYTRNTDITANDLINQSVIDYTASSVYFPIISLHPIIGCDCPNTVELCRNRLVWACSDGNIYTLSGQNQFSERNIYALSDMIHEKLKTEYDLKNAFSVDWAGHYLLFVKNHVYVMDYESYGYVYVSSHTKTENAQEKIPWWHWEIPGNVFAAIKTDDSLFIVMHQNDKITSQFIIKEISENYKKDDNDDIRSIFQTKLFDFNLPQYNKTITAITVFFANNKAVPITVDFITEHGSETQTVILNSNKTSKNEAGHILGMTLFPCIKSTAYFGIRFSCNGNMFVQRAILNYKILGGVK